MKNLFVSDITLAVAGNKSLTFREKLNIADLLEKAGVNAIELPEITNNIEDAVVYSTIAESLNSAAICVPCTSKEQISAAYECIKNAKSPCLQVVMPISTVQMEYKYHLKSNKMLEKIAELCKAAADICDNVEFVALDATRAEVGFAEATAKVAAENGAKAVTLCDDCGTFTPDEFGELVIDIKEAANVKVYVKPSNNLLLAAACALECIKAGADGVKTSVFGEDNVSLNGLANLVDSVGEDLGVKTNINTTVINNIVKNIQEKTVNTAIESEHTDSSELDNTLTLTDIEAEINALGYELSNQDVGKVYEEFKRVVSKKDSIGKRELEAIIASTAMQVPSTYHLVNYVVNSGNIINATANITLSKDGEELSGVSIGDGPIDAAFHAIEQIIGHHYELDDFQIQAVTKGREAVGSSIIRLRAGGKLYSGNGVSTDIIGACIRAYINALNKIVYEEK